MLGSTARFKTILHFHIDGISLPNSCIEALVSATLHNPYLSTISLEHSVISDDATHMLLGAYEGRRHTDNPVNIVHEKLAALLYERQKREPMKDAYGYIPVPVHEVFKVNLNSKKSVRSCYNAVGLDSKDLDEYDISDNQISKDMISEALVAFIGHGLKRMRFRYCLCGNITSLFLTISFLFH